MLRLFRQKAAGEKGKLILLRLLAGTDLDPFPAEIVPGGAGELVALSQIENALALPVSDIRPDGFFVIEHSLLPGVRGLGGTPLGENGVHLHVGSCNDVDGD